MLSLLSSSANERTFLAWMSMAVSLGGVSTALVGFTAEEDPRSKFSFRAGRGTHLSSLSGQKTKTHLFLSPLPFQPVRRRAR